MIVKVGVN